MEISRSPGTVRRCARCGQDALVVVHAWQHRFAKIDTRTETLELQCQSCGTGVVLHPLTVIRAERIIATLLIPAIFPGLVFFARARAKARAWTDNPVVEGAAQPAPLGSQGENARVARPRYDPVDRRCDCGAIAPCSAIVRQGTWARPIGTRYDHRCPVCSKSFAVHSVGGVLFASALATLLSVVGALFILHSPGSAVGAEQSNRAFGVGLVFLSAIAWLVFAWRVRGRRAHPVLRPR